MLQFFFAKKAVMTDPHGTQNRFMASRKQLQRILRISAMLKRQPCVKMKDIVRAFASTEFEAGAYLGCGNRTIQRDIRIWKDEYGAPIEYSKSQCAYRLTDCNWSLQLPALLSPEEVLAIAVSDRVMRDIFPQEISGHVSKMVDEVLHYNKSEELAAWVTPSLRVFAEQSVSDGIFMEVFEAWRKHLVVQIRYADRDGNAMTLDVEPHALVFHDMVWSIKGFCRSSKAIRVFRLGRISAASIKDEPFSPRQSVKVSQDELFDYDTIPDVELELNERGRRFAELYPLHSQQDFVEGDDKSFRMFVPAVDPERLTLWVLRQQGDAKPVAPARAVAVVRTAVRNLADACQAYDPDEIRKKVRKLRAQEPHS